MMNTSKSPLIQADNIAVIRNERLIFNHLSLSVFAGQAIHLKGQNGSGKTTFFNVLLGLLKADLGQITYAPSLRIMYLGHQNAIKSSLSVIENIRLNSLLFDGVLVNDSQIAEVLLALRLSDFADVVCGDLSAGQQRRVMLARLFLNDFTRGGNNDYGAHDSVGRHEKGEESEVNKVSESHQTYIRANDKIQQISQPTLLLLDEPLTALDSPTIKLIQQRLDDCLARGVGVIVTSHQPIVLTQPMIDYELPAVTDGC